MSLDQLTRPEVDTGDDYLLRLDAARDEIWDSLGPRHWQKQIVKKPERLAQIRFAGAPNATVIALNYYHGLNALGLHFDATQQLHSWAEEIYLFGEKPTIADPKRPMVEAALAEYVEDLAVKRVVKED